MALDGGHGSRDGRPPMHGITPIDERRIFYYVLWPMAFISIHPDYLLLHRLVPEGADRTRVICEWLFEAGTIAWVGDHRPGWPRWLNAMDLAPSTLRLASELACRGLSVDWHAIDAGGMARAASIGLEVAAWTVRRRATAARLERLGVVAICVEATALDG